MKGVIYAHYSSDNQREESIEGQLRDFACKVQCVIRSVGVAAKMRLPPGRASTFEAAGKQGCDCVTWSRKHRVGFISRQGVYEGIFVYPTPVIYNRIFSQAPISRTSNSM